MHPAEWVPHREQTPVRQCSECKALLSTGNETSECWQCGGTWDATESRLGVLIGEAIDRILAEA